MRWIVHKVNPRQIGEAFFRADNGEREWMTRCVHRTYDATSDEEPEAIGTYHCDSERDALILADILVKREPSSEVYVCQTKHVLCAARPTVITKSVTDKGVLPA